LGKDYTAYAPGHYFGFDPAQILDLTVMLNGQLPGISPGLYIQKDSDLVFLYTIYNSSLSSMTISSLVDDNGTPANPADDVIVCQNLTLPGQTSQTCSRTITALEGSQLHAAVVTGMVAAAPVTDSVTASYYGVRPGITLDLHTNGQDPGSPMELLINVDEPVKWEYFIQNTSNVMLTDISLIDPPGNILTCPSSTLLVGESMTCSVNGTAVPGIYQNDAHVKGVWPDALQVFNAEAASYYFGVDGKADLDFRINSQPADTPPGPELFLGEAAILSYIVKNTGNYLMTDISVSDTAGNPVNCSSTALGAGMEMTCTAQEIVSGGLQSRTGTVTGLVNGKTVAASNPIYYTGIPRTYQVFLPFIKR
jgi:hypothetical protein